MAELDIATYTSAMKNFFEPIFERQYPEQTVMMDAAVVRIDEKNVVGLDALIAVEWLSWAGAAAAPEGAEIVNPAPGRYGQVQVPMRYHYGAMRLTGPAIEATKNDAGAFAPAHAREAMHMINVFHRHENRMACGDGSGVLCMTAGAPSGNTIAVDNAFGITHTTNGDMFLSQDVEIDIYSAKTGGSLRGSCTIVSVAPSTSSSDPADITVDAMPDGVENNDYIFLKGARGIEPMGLLGIVDTSDFVGTLQGQAYAANNQWGAQKIQGATAGTVEALTRSRLMRLRQRIIYRGGGKSEFMISNPDVQTAYADMCDANNIKVNTVKLDAGWEGVEWMGMPWLADQYFPPYRVMEIDPSLLRRYQMMPAHWLDRGTGVLKQVGRTDMWEQQYGHYLEWGTRRRAGCGVLEDIEVIAM